VENNNPEGKFVMEPFIKFVIIVFGFSLSAFLLGKFAFPHNYDKKTGETK